MSSSLSSLPEYRRSYFNSNILCTNMLALEEAVVAHSHPKAVGIVLLSDGLIAKIVFDFLRIIAREKRFHCSYL